MKPTTENKPIILDLPELSSASSFTGESVRLPRLEVPQIRVSYKADDDDARVAPKGEFVQYNPTTKESTALGKKITIQILHHRQSLSAFKQLGGGSTESYYTPEISMKETHAPLFMASTGADGKRVQKFLMEGEFKKGVPGSLRDAFPDLRYQRSLYILHDSILKNLVVYGSSFSGFLDFTKAIQGVSSSAYQVELTTKKEKTGTVIYYPIVFTAKDKSNMSLIEPTGIQLSKWFIEYDNMVVSIQNERKEQAAIDRGDGSVKTSTGTTLPPAKGVIDDEPEGEPLPFEDEKKVTIEEAEEALGTKE